MKRFRIQFALAISLLITTTISAQNIGINSTGNAPDASAMLDITSTDKGMLIPRMTLAQRVLIATPAIGLLVYQTDGADGFWFYDGAVWVNLTENADNDWTVSGSNQYSAVSANVGIGTNTPTHKLDMLEADSISVRLRSDGNAVLILEADTSNVDENKNPSIKLIQDGGLVSGNINLIGDAGTISTNSLGNSMLIGSNNNQSHIQFAPNNITRMTIRANNGRIGIGTNNPQSGLHILQQSNNNVGGLRVYNTNGTDYTAIFTANDQATLEARGANLRLRLGATTMVHLDDFDKYMGVLTTTPTSELDVNGTTTTNNLIVQGSNNTQDSTNTRLLKVTNGAGIIGQVLTSTDINGNVGWVNSYVTPEKNIYTDNGTLTANRVVTQGGFTLDFNPTIKDGFRIDGTTFSVDPVDDRIGLGTANPRKNLHIYENSTNESVLLFTNDDTGNGAGNGLHVGLDNNEAAYIWNKENTSLSFATNDTEKLTIEADGDFGFNTTAPVSDYHFHMPSATMGVRWSNSTTGTTSADGTFFNFNNNDVLFWNRENGYFSFGTNDTERIHIEAGGQVGIGTSSPREQLHVHVDGNNESSLKITNGNSGNANGDGIEFGLDGASTAFLENKEVTDLNIITGEDIRFFTDDAGTSTERVTILGPSGKVGIGTDAPTRKLHVAGLFRLEDGSQAANKVLTSDANGNASWSFPDASLWTRDASNNEIYPTTLTDDVGIGTADPNMKLHVEEDNNGGFVARIRNTGDGNNSAGADGLLIQLSNTDNSEIDGDNEFIRFVRSNNVTVGQIKGFNPTHTTDLPPAITDSDYLCYYIGKGMTSPQDFILEAAVMACLSGGVVYESGNGDYAEYLEREDHEKDLFFGQVVGVKGGKISTKTEDAEQLMIVSAAPIMLGAMPDSIEEKNYEMVAFMGQVPCWVIGDVNSGDYIIPSGNEDGSAIAISPKKIKLKQVSKIVGKAWSSASALENEQANLINVVVGIKTNELADLLQKEVEKINSLEQKVNSLEVSNTEIKFNNEKLSKDVEAIKLAIGLNAEAKK